MTHDQIDRLIRQANPVRDLRTLEPVETSVLLLDEQRRTEMQTNDRIHVDQEPEKPRRGFLIGIAAAVAIAIGALVIFQLTDEAPVADDGPPQTSASAVEIATSFLEAFAGFDPDTAASYLDGDLLESEFGGLEGLRLETAYWNAQGFKLLVGTCEAGVVTPAGTAVSCPYDYHAIRSDEMGLGPYVGSHWNFIILDGKVVSASNDIRFLENGFDAEVWGPFAAWVSQTYPDDAAVMYTDSSRTMSSTTEESSLLWEQHTKSYAAVQVATSFVEAYASFDVDTALSYMAHDGTLPWPGDEESVRLYSRLNQGRGFQYLLGTCQVDESGTSATSVRVNCPFDYHAIGSDQIGMGPYGGSRFHIDVVSGEIVNASEALEFMSNGFNSEMWVPFGVWVGENHPEDAALMYANANRTLEAVTEESIALWEQHTREYVEVVGQG